VQLADEPNSVATPCGDSTGTACELRPSSVESLGAIRALQVILEPARTVDGAFTLKVTAYAPLIVCGAAPLCWSTA
jgi:hypothetical protein